MKTLPCSFFISCFLSQFLLLSPTSIRDRTSHTVYTNVMPTVYVVCKQGNDSQKAVKWLRQYTHRQCASKEDGIAGSKSHKHDNRQDSIDPATNRAVVFRDIKGGLAAWSKQIDNNFPIYWRSESKVCVRPDCLSNIAMNFPKLGDSCFSTSDIKPPTQARTGPETAENSDGKTPRYGGRWPKSARHKKIRKKTSHYNDVSVCCHYLSNYDMMSSQC